MLKKMFIINLSLISFPFVASAQQPVSASAELSCRSQAKEVAVQTYQSCVTTARQKRIEEIRKEYQSKLNDLKSHYDSELKKLSPSQASQTANGSQGIKVGLKQKKSKDTSSNLHGNTTILPKKKNEIVQTLPVQNVQESTDAAVQVIEDTTAQESVNVVEPESQSE